MKVDAIIFDKDGTLIDFDAFWVSVSVKALASALSQLGMKRALMGKILPALGVKDGVTDIDGVLCKGTYEEIGEIVHNILHGYGCTASQSEVVKVVLDAFNGSADAGEIKPTCPNLDEVLRLFKSRGKRLAVVTTDNAPITKRCLEGLGVYHLFDKIYTDDGNTPTKPNPYCAEDFLKLCSLERDKVVMVGDTLTDVRFAKNAGIKVIGIAKNEKNKATLSPFADAVVTSPAELIDILE